MTPRITPSQTVGPFFHDALLRPDATRQMVAQPGAPGERIRIEGHVLDADGAPMDDAMVEIWHADHAGTVGGAFLGFGRSGTDADGQYWFETIRPGRVMYDGTRLQASHINVVIVARGLLNHLFTRLYFADDETLADDPVLALVPAGRRASLLALRRSGDGRSRYVFDIALGGQNETVFFDYRPSLRGSR